MEPQYVAIHRDIGREIIGIRCEKMGYTDIYIMYLFYVIYLSGYNILYNCYDRNM